MPANQSPQLHLDQLIEGEREQLQHLIHSSFPGSEAESREKFARKLYETWLNNNPFAAEISDSLQSLLPAVVTAVEQDVAWIFDTESPLHQQITHLHHYVIGWDANLGRAGSRFLDQLNPLLAAFNRSGGGEALEAFLNSEQQRIDKLEQRLHASEVGNLRSQRARDLSARVINQKTAGKQLPQTITGVLQQDWREWLRLLLLREGTNNDAFLRLSKLLETVVWTFQPHSIEQQQAKLYDVIGSLADEIRAAIRQAQLGIDCQTALQIIDAEHVKLLKNIRPDYAPFAPIDSDDPLPTQTVVSRTLLKAVDQLGTGQWFRAKHTDQQPRYKLSLKLSDTQQLLLTNFAGIKAAQFSYEEFAYQLSRKTIVKISPGYSLADCARSLITKLFSLHQERQLQTARSQAEQAQRAVDQARQQAEELAELQRQQRAEQEQRKLEELEERQRQLAEQEKRIASQLEQASARASQAALAATRLSVGSWIESGAGDAAVRYKLAVKIQSTGKYIFVDNTGLKKAEMMPDELVAKIIAGDIRIIKHGSDFEDALATVVNKLRNDKNSQRSDYE